ncbi:MAG: stage II sporulation protein M [Acidobacteriota bacterium]|nr:stage II sporulation protein M [Acidobacteriota bacterium]
MIDIESWARAREERWRRLGELLDRSERSPERELGASGMRELLSLYRTVSSDLNQARSLTANPEILGRLNSLAGLGYRFIYRARRDRGGEVLLRRTLRLLGEEIPAAFRQEARAVAVAAAALLLGALLGAGVVLLRPGAAEDIIPAEFSTASPRQRVEQIERRHERISSVADAATFGAQLYTHNIQVSFLVFGMCALTLFGGVYLLFWNGVLLGAVATTYFLDGVSAFFFAWVGPHGAFELPAIAFSGAAGLVLGRALLLPGELSRGASVRAAFPRVAKMMLGVMLILVLAGLIEGSFSQFSAKTVPYPLKIAVAATLLISLFAYLFLPRQGFEAAR